jgi:hypothetical protein
MTQEFRQSPELSATTTWFMLCREQTLPEGVGGPHTLVPTLTG